jgi:hypothetical protein
MNDCIPIHVECHSGYKADEYPNFFYWNGEKHEIKEISEQCYQMDCNSDRPAGIYYKVKTTCEKQYILIHCIEVDEWYLLTGSYQNI